MNDCQECRGRLVDYALRSLPGELRSEVLHHLAACPACRTEAAQLRRLVALVQSSSRLPPSGQFRARLERRLDELEHEELEPLGWREDLRFHGVFFLHRLRVSARLRWQLAAVAASFAIALTLGLRAGMDSPASRRVFQPDSVARAPHRVAVPAEESEWLKLQLLDETVDVAPFEPRFDEPSPPRARAQDPAAIPWEAREEAAPPPDPPLERAVVEAPLPEWPSPAGSSRPGSAVERALNWLGRQQREDGSWTPGEGDPDLRVAVTALALMAFQSEGFLGDGVDPANRAVRKAVQALTASQGRDGIFGCVESAPARCFNHSTACLALLEHHLLGGTVDRAAGAGALAHALDALEASLVQLYGRREDLRRCQGENAAWAALALWTAEESGIDWHLSAYTGGRVDTMLAELRLEQPALVEAAVGTGLALARVEVHPREWSDWERVVVPLLEHPESADPTLRFLVASALYPWKDRSTGARLRWERFDARLREALLAQQDPRNGFFRVPRVSCLDGGDVLDTALCVLALQVPRRSERLRAAVEGR